ncbi:immunoglobulin superfamily member 1-like isoform X2 [Pelodiscus sinensis]|uniref:immunoglobulin superfamily member 1-like isoform X2 n=1 Tax=Pelodiscus sinensis TaxID=13735 RepID=UPI003F6B10BE
MKPTRLLPLLASLQMLPRTVSPADPLQAPQLTMSPQQPVYISGEAVTLTCWAAGASAMARIQFFWNSKEIVSEELPLPRYHYTHSMELPRVTGQQHGAYSCAYWSTESGQKIQSMKSQLISITVTARPPAPELTVSPQYRIFLRGESVTLKCSTSSTATASRFLFFKDGQSIDSREVKWYSYNVRSLYLSSVSQSQAGAYSCKYWETESGREIPSERSQNIPIAVTARSSVPKLTLSSPSPVLLRGESVTLTCSVPNTDKVSEIRFFRDDKRISSSEFQWSQYRVNASLLLLNVSDSQAGKYSCGYWEKGTRREISSERSQNVVITVTAWLPAPKLTVSPEHSIFLREESVTLMCSAPPTAKVSGMWFFKDGQRIDSRAPQWPGSTVSLSLQLWSVSELQAIEYSCGYWETMSRREIPSERSRPILILVTASLPAPKLTLFPQQPVYIIGETVTLMCSAAGEPTLSRIQFFYYSQKIQFKELSSPRDSHNESLPLLIESMFSAGQYSCESWKTVSGREIKSARSQPSSIRVTARPPPPRLSLDPLLPIYIRGDPVTLRCSSQLNEEAAGYRFFNQRGEQISSRESSQGTWQISTSDAATSQAYTCLYWREERGREIPSEMSPPVPVPVTDPPPQPELSMDPPSGAVREGFSLNITCTVSGDTSKRRFLFYKDGVKLVPGDLGSEISTKESITSSVKGSVLSIPRAGPNITGEFTCGYEENMAGRWIPSPRSQAVNITENIMMSASYGDILLGTGGVLLLIAALAALLCYWHRKKRVPKTPKTMEGVELGERPRNLDPAHDSKGSKATDAGAEEAEQDSEVTYALLVLPSSPAHTTQSKNKATPVEDEHVLYSEVVTIRTQKKAK